jgi:uncharacterized protein GlcG (DUF336 family)
MNSQRRSLITTLLGAGSAITAGILTVGAGPAEAQAAAAAAARRRRGPFTSAELDMIISNAVTSANATNSPIRSIGGTPRTTKMHIAVVDREGSLLVFHSMDDAWEGSRDIAIAKARTAAFFSSDENALTSRIVGELSEPHANDGSGGAGPLWGIWASNQVGITGGSSTRNGIITFPGGIPLYKGGHLVGGIGVSGDGVDQDETVALAGSVGFRPGASVSNPASL